MLVGLVKPISNRTVNVDDRHDLMLSRQCQPSKNSVHGKKRPENSPVHPQQQEQQSRSSNPHRTQCARGTSRHLPRAVSRHSRPPLRRLRGRTRSPGKRLCLGRVPGSVAVFSLQLPAKGRGRRSRPSWFCSRAWGGRVGRARGGRPCWMCCCCFGDSLLGNGFFLSLFFDSINIVARLTKPMDEMSVLLLYVFCSPAALLRRHDRFDIPNSVVRQTTLWLGRWLARTLPSCLRRRRSWTNRHAPAIVDLSKE